MTDMVIDPAEAPEETTSNRKNLVRAGLIALVAIPVVYVVLKVKNSKESDTETPVA